MEMKKYELRYDKEADALYIRVRRGVIAESREVAPGIIIDLDEKGRILGIEVLDFSKRRLNLQRLVLEGPELLLAEA